MKRAAIVVALLIVVLLFVGSGGVKVVKQKIASSTESKRLAGLLPEVRAALDELRRRLDAAGLPTFVGSTIRSEDEQAAILARGNSATQKSWHLLGRAIDLYPIDPATGKPDTAGRHTALFKQMHDEAARVGFRGLAFNPDGTKRYITTNKGKVWDGGHIEFPGGMTFAAALADYKKRKGAA